MSKFCKNCGFQLNDDGKHCHYCGQTLKAGELKLSTIAVEFFENIFNIDSRFFNTVRNLWRPHFLTKEYVAGRRKKYMLPIQTFLFSSFILLFISLYFADFNSLGKITGQKKFAMTTLMEKYDTSAIKLIRSQREVDTLKRLLFKDVLSENDQIFPGDKMEIFGLNKYKITYKDVYTKNTGEILEEKKITEFFDRLAVTQMIKFEFNPIGTLKFLISMLTWAVLLNILVIAFISKPLYFTQKRYYVEHLILAVNIHTAIFVLTTILVLLVNFIPGESAEDSIIGFGTAIICGLTFVGFWRYYGQGWFKTSFKFFILMIAYFTCITFSCLAILGLNFLFFI